MKKYTKSAFTLVELIVVITILAILATVAFISLGGWTSKARNSKRVSDIDSINTSIATKQASSVAIVDLIDNTTSSEMTDASFGWTGTTAADYKAGTPNYTALEIKAEEFKDPTGDNEYRIGFTTKAAGKYEVATSLEDGADRIAKIKGNFVPRLDTDTATVSAINSDGTVATLSSNDVNKFYRGDVLSDWANETIVKKVAKDGKTLTLTVAVTSGDNLNLKASDTNGLISSTINTTAANVVTDGSPTNLPY